MDSLIIPLPNLVALALVALLGYIVGRRRGATHDEAQERNYRELARAQAVAQQLDKIAGAIRRELAQHQASVHRFKDRLGEIGTELTEADWKQLWLEAEQVLHPTMQLATRIAHAYDELRQQTNMLMAFSEVRTDPLTGVRNRRALDEAFESMLAMRLRYGQSFAVAIFDIDRFKRINDEQGHLQGDRVLRVVATIIDEVARETDVVGRFGGEEFVVLMPLTDLSGGTLFAERVRRAVEETGLIEQQVTISGGVTEAADGDDVQSLLARADSALYYAKQHGRNLIARHDGEAIDPVQDIDLASTLA